MRSRAKRKIIARSLNSRSRSRSVGGIEFIQLLATEVASDHGNARSHTRKICLDLSNAQGLSKRSNRCLKKKYIYIYCFYIAYLVFNYFQTQNNWDPTCKINIFPRYLFVRMYVLLCSFLPQCTCTLSTSLSCSFPRNNFY